jgi:AraC family transcriptional regulator
MLTNSLFTNAGSRAPHGASPTRLRHFDPAVSVAAHPHEIPGGRLGSSGKRLHNTPLFDDESPSTVEIAPREVVRRRALNWHVMGAEFIELTSNDRVDSRFHAPVHLLVAHEQGMRREGETFLEGLPRSNLRDFSRKLTFVPAGHEYHEWQEARTSTRLLYFYLDPAALQIHADTDIARTLLTPRLFFEDTTLWGTALKLKHSIENPAAEGRLYSEALGVVLAHEIVQLSRGARCIESFVRGGLAAWQQKVVAAYIEDHLSENISLATLARLARLSPYHFCRAFKQSFGMPPHRYHTDRRLERAKSLLAKRMLSVTEIGLIVGFRESSSFAFAFRKATGLTPSSYRRTLG